MNALSICDLSMTFGGLQVISDLNLDIPSGQRHAVIGPNGAGKTTLLDLITGWEAPTTGGIVVDGRPVRHGRPDLIARSGLSRSFQRNMLLESLTVFENLRIACQAFDASRRSVLRLCSAFPDILRQAHRAAEVMRLGSVLDRNVHE